MRILVTGANGLLATNTILLLLTEGYQVVGLLQSPEKYIAGSHPNLELFKGDITNLKDLESASDGCDVVMHIAAITDQNRLKYEAYQYVNVIGTKHVLSAAKKQGVKKVVFVSSANTFGYGDLDNLGDETQPIKAPFSQSFYSLSKLEAQQWLVKQAKEKDSPKIIIVNPSFMIGGYDSKPSSGQIIQMFYRKKIIFYPPGGKNFIHVKDAAQGVVNAMLKGKHGESYILGNENLSYRQFFQKLGEVSGRKYILIGVPPFALQIGGWIGDLLRKLGVATNLSSGNMQTLCISNFYTNRKATRDLELSYRPIQEAIEDALKWFEAVATKSG